MYDRGLGELPPPPVCSTALGARCTVHMPGRVGDEGPDQRRKSLFVPLPARVSRPCCSYHRAAVAVLGLDPTPRVVR